MTAPWFDLASNPLRDIAVHVDNISDTFRSLHLRTEALGPVFGIDPWWNPLHGASHGRALSPPPDRAWRLPVRVGPDAPDRVDVWITTSSGVQVSHRATLTLAHRDGWTTDVNVRNLTRTVASDRSFVDLTWEPL